MKKIKITITANSGPKVYDGSVKAITNYTVGSGLLPGHLISGIVANGSGTNVGSYPVTFTGTPVIMNGTVNVTSHYKFNTR